ncbi:MAG: TonB-dependent receptor [Thermodesulfobacteriota bacterium]
MTDQEKMAAVEEMFSSPYGEEDYYRTNRLLVAATRRSMALREAPAIATIVTAAEIRDMGAQSLMDVLKLVPGIGIARNEQGFFMFEVRGVSTVKSEKILIMIDGHSLNKNYAGSGLVNFADQLSVENIKQIEIVRGPGSALYGANAFLAVINIITKDAFEAEGARVAVAGGSFDTRKVDASYGKIFDNGFQLLGSLDYWKTNGPNLMINRDRHAGTPISQAPAHADTTYDALEGFLRLSLGSWTYEGHFVRNHRGAYIGFANALTDDNTLLFVNYWHEISYQKEITSKLSTSLKVYWDEFKQDALCMTQPSGFLGSYPQGMVGGPKVKDRTVGEELQLDYDTLADHHVLLGLAYESMQQYDVRSLSNFHPITFNYLGSIQDISAWGNWNRNVVREIYAAYFQDEWRVLDDLDLTAGIRHDHYDDFGGTTNPRLGLVWRMTREMEVKLLFGQAFRAPNFSELYNANNPFLVGSPDLKPERIRTYEVGIGSQLLPPVRVDLNYFHNDIDEMIVRDFSTMPNRYANAGGAVIDGIECVLTGEYRLGSYWKLFYGYQDPREADNGRRLPNVPRQRASFSLNYALSDHLSSHGDILWTGSRPRIDGDPRGDMPPFATVDLALTARQLRPGLEVRGVIHNLFDASYADPDLSGPAGFIPDDYPRTGISTMLTVEYRF